MSENPVDRKAARMQVSAEEARKSRAANIELGHKKKLNGLEIDAKKLDNKQKKRQSRSEDKQGRRDHRKETWQKLAKQLQALMPTVGRRVMITGPILAPMAVAWIGQIGFAHDKLGWPILGALVFAAAWEMTTAFTGWMYHQSRRDGDRGTLFRVATWIFASSAGAMNYWHACPTITERLNVQDVRRYIDLSPTPKAVSYGAMSLVGIALWELYSSLIHRKHLRAEGIVSSARPRFGILRWVRFTRITWHAWSLAVRYGIKTVDEAWAKAVSEIERVDRARAVAAEQKRLTKDKRPAVRVVLATTLVRTVAQPKTKVRLFWTDQSATTLTATIDHPGTTTARVAVATAIATGRIPGATTGRKTLNDHPQPSSDRAVATTNTDRSDDHPNDQATGRSRPGRKTSATTGRRRHDQEVADQSKTTPTVEDNQRAVSTYLRSVQDGRPLSQRSLAKQFGFSKTWARDRIQEAGPQPVGGTRPTVDREPDAAPKDQPTTSEVKTG